MFVLGNFSKFIRPGYYRVGVTGGGEGILASAYLDSTNFVIVAVNPRTRSFSCKFTLPDLLINGNAFLPHLVTPWVTSSRFSLDKMDEVAITNSSFSYLLPSQSVVSFVGHLATVVR